MVQHLSWKQTSRKGMGVQIPPTPYWKVAQLARASVWYAEGYEFNSRPSNLDTLCYSSDSTVKDSICGCEISRIHSESLNAKGSIEDVV